MATILTSASTSTSTSAATSRRASAAGLEKHPKLGTGINTDTASLDIPIFAGQGTAMGAARAQALQDAQSAAGATLLAACFEAFHAEVASISDSAATIEIELDLELDAADFPTPAALLAPAARYAAHPLLAGLNLFLVQALRYLAHAHSQNHAHAQQGSQIPQSALARALANTHAVLGFSSGVLPAVLAAASPTLSAYLAHAVQAFRLAFWVGARVGAHRAKCLEEAGVIVEDADAPWSIVLLGGTHQLAEAKLQQFAATPRALTPLYITATIDPSTVTISGRPDVLAKFTTCIASGNSTKLPSAPAGLRVHKTDVPALYHAPEHAASGLRDRVLADLTRRAVGFPRTDELRVAVWNTGSGARIGAGDAPDLVAQVVDMLLTQPVRWDRVAEGLASSLASQPPDVTSRLLNFGPGMGLVRGLARALDGVGVLDVSVSRAERNPSSNERDGETETRAADAMSAAAAARAAAGDDIPSAADTREHVSAPRTKQEPIAIVGMAVNMPGAPDAAKLWELLQNGVNTISEIPEDRFKVEEYNGPNAKNPKRAMKAHTGNFLADPAAFDNRFFKISPREAKSMDPQQRLLLHAAALALEDAGYVPHATPTSDPAAFGVYVGVATGDYVQNLREEVDVYYSTGTLRAFLSGRISFAMQLSGPSIVVDTACSSSNVALYQGARALMNGDCDAALVGGVNVVSSPDMFLGLDRGHFLSPTGQCKAFDAGADGYARSEGVGLFVLKRLRDAVAEGDNILGVVRGIEVNQSGRAHSITYPHAATQATLFRRVLEHAGLEARRVSVVEAHGTGTQAGDPNEVESLRSVLATGVDRGAGNPLHITSVKANIGHLEAASGAAGLAKLLLMLKHKRIPAQISLKTLNPRIAPLASDNTVIATREIEWAAPGGLPRVALLNNFGAAGSNTALLLEEHIPASRALPADVPVVVGLSAKTQPALEDLRAKYTEWLRVPAAAAIPLPDIAYSATARRQVYEWRLAVSAGTHAELAERLAAAAPVQRAGGSAQAVFVFSGQGGQYAGMGRGLYEGFALFRGCIDECEEVLRGAGFPGVKAVILAEEKVGTGLPPLEEMEAYQPAIVALECALARLWVSWGVVPAAVAGHSLGEYAALVTAGVLTLEDALLLVATRVRFMVRKCTLNATGMLAVNLGPDAAATALRDLAFGDVTIACYNSPADCVLAGPIDRLKALKAQLDAKSTLLSVPFGYHSVAMQPLLADLTAAAQRIPLRAPSIPVVSNLLGDVVVPGDASVFTAGYFARHCGEPVQFARGVRALLARPEFARVDAWLELGPHATSLPMLKANPAIPSNALLLPSLRKSQPPAATLAASLAQLYTSDLAPTIKWRAAFAHLPVRCVSLPAYPLATTKFWVPFAESAAPPPPPDTTAQVLGLISEYAMLSRWVQYPAPENGCEAVYETPIGELASAIEGHSVGGLPLCPASVYIELVFAGVELGARHLKLEPHDSHVVLRRLEFEKPLVYDVAVTRKVITRIVLREGHRTFTVGSRVCGGAEAVHVRGEFRCQPTLRTTTKFVQALPVIARHIAAVGQPQGGASPEVFSTRTAYEVIFPRVVDYARQYHTMQTLTVDASGMEGCATIQLPADYDRGKFVVHPVWMDTLLHVAGFVANMHGGLADAYICTQVGAVKVFPELVNNDKPYLVYCTNAWLPEEGVMLAEAYAVQVAEPRRIVAHMKGMHFRRLRLSSLKKSLALAAGRPAVQAQQPTKAVRIAPTASRASRSPSPPPAVDVEAVVLKLVADACDIPPAAVGVDTDLAAIGIDSMMSIEIFGGLRGAFPGAALDAQVLAFCPTVADICREVRSKLQASSSSKAAPSGGTHTVSAETSSPRTLFDDKSLELDASMPDGTPDVIHILSNVLEVSIDSLGADADLDALGLDSLTAIEALHALKTEFGLDLPDDFFLNYSTPRAVQAYIAGPKSGAAVKIETVAPVPFLARQKVLENTPPPTPPSASLGRLTKALQLDTVPVPIQRPETSGRLPLFLIHDGSGLVNYYDRLSFLDRAIWGIHNPHFASGDAWDGLVDMAAAYVEYILSATSGPLLLGGWSFGGVAAYEIALQLTRRGVQVKGILLIDAPSPINHIPLSDALIDAVLDDAGRPASGRTELRGLVKRQFSTNARMLGQYVPHATASLCPPLVLLRSSEGFAPTIPGGRDTEVPTWLADRSDPQTAVKGWQRLAHCEVKVLDIPGNHFQAFHSSNIAELSLRIADGCEYLESL
ncbi:beta-ketoacyl synthase [Mycena rosella]|uniref:Beta-ketoacyl synthase n=1 Tax=Mycena rosella TaxID=1033263 RepID=A0AAD7GT49_MYCRO|nr:beta-ketoacyl synthase [Mycena rosella]